MIVAPSSVPSLPRAVMDAQKAGAAIRMGVVARVMPQAQSLLVRISNAEVATPAAWLTSYEPMIGDVVAVTRQDAGWVVLGSLGTALDPGTNLVANYTFDSGAIGALPPQWQLVTSAGSPTLVSADYPRADVIDGSRVAKLTSPGAATITTEVVSDPIPITSARQWVVGGSVRTLTDFAMSTACSVQVYAAWYTSVNLAGFISQVGSGAYAVTRGMPWTLIQVQDAGEAVVSPVNASWMRVKFAFSWAAAAGDSVYIDRVIVRNV